MDIDPFVSSRAMREFLSNVTPERKYIDKNMINNVSIRSWKKWVELEIEDIEIDPKRLDTSFITSYRDTFDNYTEGKYYSHIVWFIFIIVVKVSWYWTFGAGHINMINDYQYKNDLLIWNISYFMYINIQCLILILLN